jgi:hypothetical protein
MSIDGLFIEAPAFEKVAQVKLSSDAGNWPIEVMRHLHEEHPYLAEAQSEVVLKTQDPLRGYAMGMLKIGESVRVPIIIKEWKMAPLDVWLDDKGEANVLNEDSIKRATMSTSLGSASKVEVPGRVDASLYNRTYAPYDGKYVYASARGDLVLKTKTREWGSVLSLIDLTEAEKKAWVEAIPESCLVAFKNSGTLSVIGDFVKQAIDASALAMNVPTKGDPLPDAVVLEDMEEEEEEKDPQTITAFGTYKCQGSSSNAMYVGKVFPKIYDFNLQPLPFSIFKGELVEDDAKDDDSPRCTRRASAIQASIAGVPCKHSDEVSDDYAGQGDYGFFVEIRQGAAVALKPVKVLVKSRTDEKHETSKSTLDHKVRKKVEICYDVEKYHCQDDLGQQVTIIRSPRVQDVARNGNDVLIPASMKFVRLENSVSLKSDPGQVKTAGRTMLKLAMAGSMDTVRFQYANGAVSLHGDAVPSEYWGGVLPEQAAEWLGEWMGGSEEKRAEAAQKVQALVTDPETGHPKHGDFSVTIGQPRTEAPAGPSEAQKEAAARIAHYATDFVKVASTLQDAGLVDTVLSLSFLTPENVAKYAELVPQFEEATQGLADLLVASRIGLQIEEHQVKVAMENMAKVVDELKMLKGR